MSQLI